jgi:hypothetical protein
MPVLTRPKELSGSRSRRRPYPNRNPVSEMFVHAGDFGGQTSLESTTRLTCGVTTLRVLRTTKRAKILEKDLDTHTSA